MTTAHGMLGNFSYRLSFATEEQAPSAPACWSCCMIFENIAVLLSVWTTVGCRARPRR